MIAVAKAIKNFSEQIFGALMKYPLILWGFVAVCTVVIVDSNIKGIPVVTIAVCAIVLAIIFSTRISLLLTAIAIILIVNLRIISIENNNSSIKQLIGNKITLEFTLYSYPSEKDVSVDYVFKAQKADVNGKEYLFNNVLLKAKFNRYFVLEKNYVYTLNCTLKEPENFNDFDYKSYLDSQGIFALAECAPFILHKDYAGNFFSEKLLSIRTFIVQSSRKTLPEPHAGLLIGMLIGSKENFSVEFTDVLSISGTTHVIAVSGFNVNVISNILLGLAGTLPRKTVILFIIFTLICFMFIVGWENIPAMRATFMIVSTLIAKLSGRKSAVWSALGFSVLILILLNPYCIKLLSFQLSFAATLGLLILPDKLAVLIRYKGKLFEEFITTLSAIVATFPISYIGFGLLNSWALPANIILAPLVPIIMLSGVVHILVFVIYKTKIVAFLTWLLLELFVKGNYFFAGLPFAKIDLVNYKAQVIVIYLFLLMVILKRRKYIHET